ncbi:hypothetical protein LGM57_10785 [Burkholderia cepacia]|uniref:hypothetical protein n=1 Tax=Burkholderia cepacia TaxID=292 RepID=UPI001CF3A565|nr:hypothetical protein [Burkholderia cepacia]MCA7976805.1 hypothetical protein [Burkholderia cepacia]
MPNQVAAIPSPDSPVLKPGGGMSDVWWRFICVTLLQRTGGAGGVDAGQLQKEIDAIGKELTALDVEFHSASPLAAMIAALFDRVLWLESNAGGPVPIPATADEVPVTVAVQVSGDDVLLPVSLPAMVADEFGAVPYVGNSVAVRQDGTLGSSVSLGNSAASSAATLTNAPVAGNPSKWVPIDDQGTTRYLPIW